MRALIVFVFFAIFSIGFACEKKTEVCEQKPCECPKCNCEVECQCPVQTEIPQQLQISKGEAKEEKPKETASLSISEILKNKNKYLDKEVSISGTFQGWQGINSPPPVTKSDWVLKDNTGSIYVNGPYPEGCSAPSTGIGKAVTVKGVVRQTKDGQLYIRAK